MVETRPQTSFIPKRPIASEPQTESSISLFLLLSILVFILTLGWAAGWYFWQGKLVRDIEQDKVDLENAQASYDQTIDTINNYIRLDSRLKVSKDLLNKHIAVTPIFTLLENNTSQNVRFRNFKFGVADGNKVAVSLQGVGRDYKVISNQADQFAKVPSILTPVISNFALTPDGGVSFDFTATVDPKLLNYASTLDLSGSTQ